VDRLPGNNGVFTELVNAWLNPFSIEPLIPEAVGGIWYDPGANRTFPAPYIPPLEGFNEKYFGNRSHSICSPKCVTFA
jgi:hypothetical protein